MTFLPRVTRIVKRGIVIVHVRLFVTSRGRSIARYVRSVVVRVPLFVCVFLDRHSGGS